MHLELFDVGTVDEHVDVLEHGAVRHLLVAAAVQSQMVFVLPNLSRTALTILRTSSRFSGSSGSPPSRLRPSTKSSSSALRSVARVSSVKGLPAPKSQLSSLKQPGQCSVHPEQKSETRTPGPLAVSQVLKPM